VRFLALPCLLCLAVVACAPRDLGPSTLTVTVRTNGGTSDDIARLEVSTALGKQTNAQTVESRAFAFPVTVTAALRREAGTLGVSVLAFDADGKQVDEGHASVAVEASNTAPTVDVRLQRLTPARVVASPQWQLALATRVGESAEPVTVDLLNGGAVATEPLTLMLSGDVDDFWVTSDCAQLEPHATCTVSLTFEPTVDGRRRIEGTMGGASFAVEADGLALHSVSVSVEGDGRVDFFGNSCPGTCSTIVPHGQLVTLQATAAAHSAFKGWSIPECPGLVQTCLVAVDRALEVKATFERYEHRLTVLGNARGFAMLDVGTGPLFPCVDCDVWIPVGRTVRIVPASGEHVGFSRFAGDCSGEDATQCALQMTQARSVELQWSTLNYAFVTSEPIDGGIRSLAQADAHCQTLGPTAPTPQVFHYRAFLSTSTVPAASRFAGVRGWQLRNRKAAADSLASMLQGNLVRAIDLNEDFGPQDTSIATGTLADGGVGQTCDDWTSTSGDYTAGRSAMAGPGFTENSVESCAGPQRLLCLQTDFRSSLPLYVVANNYLRVFTSEQIFFPADGRAAADAICAAEASAAALKGIFRSALGTTVEAMPFVAAPVQVMRVDRNYGWQFDRNEAALNLTARGGYLGTVPVWLGVAASPFADAGTAEDTCADWSGGTTGRASLATLQGEPFLDHATLRPCDAGAHLLCLGPPP